MTSADEREPASQHAPGGLVKGPGGSDSVPILIDLRYERILTAEQARRFMAAKPGSCDALS